MSQDRLEKLPCRVDVQTCPEKRGHVTGGGKALGESCEELGWTAWASPGGLLPLQRAAVAT